MKAIYSQPMTKVLSMAVYGSVCELDQTSGTEGKKQDTPLF